MGLFEHSNKHLVIYTCTKNAPSIASFKSKVVEIKPNASSDVFINECCNKPFASKSSNCDLMRTNASFNCFSTLS